MSRIQYNGNITGVIWKSVHDGGVRKYDYYDDNVNRLEKAAFTEYYSGSFNTVSGVDYSVSNLSYEANDNIMSMNQNGLLTSTSTSSSPVDQLTYIIYLVPTVCKVLQMQRIIKTVLRRF